MDRIRNAIKCAICREILESPVILPCSDPICKKHVTNQSKDIIRCEKCGVEHQIPTNGFTTLPFLDEIIKSEIGQLDLGSVHKEAKISCESFEKALREFEMLLKDPYFYTHGKISELKNAVQLKGEELKMIIDEEMKKLIDRFEVYDRKTREYLLTNEFKVESMKFNSQLKIAQSNLDSWIENLNKIKLDEEKWKGIKEESERKLKCLIEESEKFKNKLLLNNFEENRAHLNCFKAIKIDSILDKVSVKSDFHTVSRIISRFVLSLRLEDLLTKKDLNGRKWLLLYQGSRDGFRASNFHSHCDNKPNTLTIVKSTSGNIFGGFTTAQWKSCELGCIQEDKSSFIFSLMNRENRPLIFEKSSNKNHSLFLFKQCGPIFGGGFLIADIFISDSSNNNSNSYSNLGFTYAHPEYPYESSRAKTILAGTYSFQVQEIEVFQLQE